MVFDVFDEWRYEYIEFTIKKLVFVIKIDIEGITPYNQNINI